MSKRCKKNIKLIRNQYQINIKYEVDQSTQDYNDIKYQFDQKQMYLFIKLIYQMKALINKQQNPKSKLSPSFLLQNSGVYCDNILPDKNDEQFVSISTSQAESYFEYLRKKIKSHNNDPFSLPFLNLKFEEIQSWKGATQQLNIQSTIYGMRVDSCHDSTMQMLNHVIRNQKNSDLTNQQNIDKHIQEIKVKNTSQGPFNLQNPNKLVAKIQTDKLLINRSLWSVIFKKSQSLQQIQLNKLSLSTSLSLNLDQNKTGISNKVLNDKSEKQCIQIVLQNINKKIEKVFNSNIIQSLNLFSEINTFKKCLEGDIDDILANIDSKSNNNIQIGRFNQIAQHIQNRDMMNLINNYYEINDTQNYKYFNDQFGFYQSKVQNPLQYMSRKKLRQNDLEDYPGLNTNSKKFNNQDKFIQFQQAQIYNQHQISELYEPQMDILFNSNLKKRKNKRINQLDDNGVIHKKKIKNLQKVQFTNYNLEHRQKCLFLTQQKDTNMRKNLLPINFVYLYENHSPFRKTIRKTQQNVSNHRFNYKNEDLSYEKQLNQNKYTTQFYDSKYTTQFYESKFTTQFHDSKYNKQSYDHINMQSDSKNDFQKLNQSKFYKIDDDVISIYQNFPIKIIKNFIQQVLITKKNQKNGILSIQSNILSIQSNIQSIQKKSSYETGQQSQKNIGLNILKNKMNIYDPLDILMSMIHLAYELQINLSVDQVLTNNQINGVNIQSYIVNDINFLV